MLAGCHQAHVDYLFGCMQRVFRVCVRESSTTINITKTITINYLHQPSTFSFICLLNYGRHHYQRLPCGLFTDQYVFITALKYLSRSLPQRLSTLLPKCCLLPGPFCHWMTVYVCWFCVGLLPFHYFDIHLVHMAQWNVEISVVPQFYM